MSTSNSPLQVTEPLHVWQLLKSSDRIQNSLNTKQPKIKFSKFTQILGGTEYRCFIRDNRLIGISQRDIHAHYSYILDNLSENSKSLSLFISEKVVPVLSDYFEETDLVVDVFKNNTSWSILDIDKLTPDTNCLLFDYDLDFTKNEKISSIEGVQQIQCYDWRGPCCLMRVRSLGNFSPNNLSITRMSQDNQKLLSGSLEPSDFISAMQNIDFEKT